MGIWFTADEHYGHDNRSGGIIFMCNRPFVNLDDMREALIARHNEKVPDSPDSVTVHLGDMFWKRLETEECVNIVKRLNGSHLYINGNHEEVFNRAGSSKLKYLFDDIANVKLMKVGKKLVWLSHYAHRTWPKATTGAYHVFGHAHGKLADYRLSHDVGVDANRFYTVSFDELDALMISKGKLPPDEVE